MGIPLYISCCFSLPAFNILSLIFWFHYNMSWCGPLWIGPVLDSVLPGLDACFPSWVRKFFCYHVFKYALFLFLCFSFSGPQNMNLMVLDVILEVLQVFFLYFYLFFFFFFSFCYLSSMISTTLSSRLLVNSSLSHNLLIPSGVFFISVIIYLMLFFCLFSNCSVFSLFHHSYFLPCLD